jgi:hypothetical protein
VGGGDQGLVREGPLGAQVSDAHECSGRGRVAAAALKREPDRLVLLGR